MFLTVNSGLVFNLLLTIEIIRNDDHVEIKLNYWYDNDEMNLKSVPKIILYVCLCLNVCI